MANGFLAILCGVYELSAGCATVFRSTTWHSWPLPEVGTQTGVWRWWLLIHGHKAALSRAGARMLSNSETIVIGNVLFQHK